MNTTSTQVYFYNSTRRTAISELTSLLQTKIFSISSPTSLRDPVLVLSHGTGEPLSAGYFLEESYIFQASMHCTFGQGHRGLQQQFKEKYMLIIFIQNQTHRQQLCYQVSCFNSVTMLSVQICLFQLLHIGKAHICSSEQGVGS